MKYSRGQRQEILQQAPVILARENLVWKGMPIPRSLCVRADSITGNFVNEFPGRI